jgi:hypothetical protein
MSSESLAEIVKPIFILWQPVFRARNIVVITTLASIKHASQRVHCYGRLVRSFFASDASLSRRGNPTADQIAPVG